MRANETKRPTMMRRLRCRLTGGHDRLMRFESDRLALRCVSCGSETPGWQLNEVPPTVTLRANALQRDAAIWSAARRIA